MSLEERAKAAAKDIEGKVQETIGKVTGDRHDQIAGKAKQAQAKAQHMKEDVKDHVKRGLDNL